MEKKTIKLLTAATGSVAAMKLPELVKALLQTNTKSNYVFEVRIIVTEHAKHFIKVADIPSQVKLYEDEDEWKTWVKRGDPVLHIDLVKWADMMVIAPLDANTLGKMNEGICDNLLTCTTRAWDMSKPLFFCPAMNTRMWEHPITAKQISTLESWGHTQIPPISKKLMCGDVGMGAMAEPDTIVLTLHNAAEQMLNKKC